MQMSLTLKALGVNLVDLFGARRTRRKPSALGDHLDSADCRTVARRDGQRVENLLAREFAINQLRRRQLFQNFLLCQRRGRVDALINRIAELGAKVVVQVRRVTPCARGHFRR